MNPFQFNNRKIHRRLVLKGVGASVALPWLGAMSPALADRKISRPVRRFVAMNAGLGFHAPFLFPEKEGRGFRLTPYLEQLEDHVGDLTVISGLSHSNQNGSNGHASQMTWLTSAERPGLAGFKNTISLDQLIANQLGNQTRLPCLNLTTTGGSLSWTANGVNIPAERSPAKLFRRLFVDGSEKEIREEMKRLGQGKSILDTVRVDAQKLHKRIGPADRQKLDEYFSSIRDLENRMQQSEEWTQKPKPKVDRQPPADVQDRNDILARQTLMYEMIVLALQTDSTRTITFDLGGMNAVPSKIRGVKTDWHNLSHHGKDQNKIDELRLIEQAEFRVFGQFLSRLKNLGENGNRLLDQTVILFGSNLGNASSHSWRNLPILVAGGPFRHGSYVAHDEKNNTRLANLFVALARQVGVKIDRFGTSDAVGIRGLEAVG